MGTTDGKSPAELIADTLEESGHIGVANLLEEVARVLRRRAGTTLREDVGPRVASVRPREDVGG